MFLHANVIHLLTNNYSLYRCAAWAAYLLPALSPARCVTQVLSIAAFSLSMCSMHRLLTALPCVLRSLGPFVETISGRERFACVYAVSAVAGSMASYAFNSQPSVGASGADARAGFTATEQPGRHPEAAAIKRTCTTSACVARNLQG